MTTKIELFDQKRQINRRGFLIWSGIFFISWFIRSSLKLLEVQNDPVYIVLLIVLLASIFFQAMYAFKDRKLSAEMKDDPLLKEAMNDELIQLNELRAWKAAFFALIGFIIFSAILSLLIPINDLMIIFLTALLVGFGTRNMTVFFLNR
jgi:hypothetical protein